ncbi:MAG TPA: ATP-binding protein [Candidatus Polarisedimenticolia bacterium]
MTTIPARERILPAALSLLALCGVALLARDASRWFSLLPPGAAIAALVIACGGLVTLWLRRPRVEGASRGPDRWRLWAAASLGALALLSANTLAREVRVQTLPARTGGPAHREAESRARLLQDQFGALLSRMTAPLEAGRARLASFGGGSPPGFALLDEIEGRTRFTRSGGGLSLYARSGTALAWSGTSFPAPPGLLDDLEDGTIAFRAVAEEHLSRLYALLASGDYILVTETTLASLLDPRIRDRVLPALAGDEGVTLRFQDFRAQETGFADLLQRHGDLYPGGSLGERPILFAGLRSPSKVFLGYARLQGSGSADLRRATDMSHRNAAALILILLLVALNLLAFYPRRPQAGLDAAPPARPALRLPADLALIWCGRVLLSWFPMGLVIGGADLFDVSLFASAGFFHLMRSPGDLLMTSAAILASAVVVTRACGRMATLASASRWAAATAAVGAGLLVALVSLAAWSLPRLTRELVDNSTVNLLAIEPLSPSPPTLTLQVSALLVLLSLFVLLQGMALLACAGGPAAPVGRILPRPSQGFSRWALRVLVPGLLLSAVMYELLLVPQSRRATAAFMENVLAQQVADQQAARRSVILRTIESLEMIPDLAEKIATGVDRTGTSLALGIWLKTPLKNSGYNASLLVLDPEGRTISRFARNLPPAFDKRAPEGAAANPDEPMLEPVRFLNLAKNIWLADHPVYSGDELVGTVMIHVLDDYDNLPFLTDEKPYARAFGSPEDRIPTLPGSSRGVRYAVYDSHGKSVFANQREPPPLPRDWTDLLVAPGRLEWSDLDEDGRSASYLFFSDGERIFTLGYVGASAIQRVARVVRLALLALVLAAVMLLPAALLAPRIGAMGWWERLLATLGRTHYRKLLSTYTAATLIPLVVLSIVMSGYITAEIDKDIEVRGRQGIGSAASLVKTILETGEQTKPDDDTLYWLSLLVGEDVNLYQAGELVATSRPALFSSGLVSPRLDGMVFRALALEGRSFAMGRESLRGEEYRTITTPLVAAEVGWEGFLSLPLDAQIADAVRGAREVADAMIITFLFMIVLMGGVGYVLAHRVSRPIRSLSAAAARIAAGDLDAVVSDRPRDETGDLISSFNRMATAIKEQREDLERRKNYIEKILLNATIGVISMDRAGWIVTANPAAGAILDLPSLAPGRSVESLFGERASLAPLARALKDPLESGPRDVDLSLPGAPPGRSVRARVVPFLEGEGIILLLEDVTETVRSNRLAAWAEMARRIAHEIKNPLTPIQLSAEHIQRVFAEESPEFPAVLEECLRTIMREVGNLRSISSEFSTYARIPTPRKELVDTSSLIEEAVRPYRTAMPPGIALKMDVPRDLPVIEVDRSLIGRAIVNLIENALQAMPRGGLMTVRARRQDSKIAIEVIDTGIGMDPASIQRIFEPYFSTKDAGTGLGLAIARKAIEEHGGGIEVASEPDRGTTMRILLPAPSAGPETG